MFQKEAVINLPKEMEFLRLNCSNKSESINQFLRRINVEQLITGRVGVLADLPDKKALNKNPYLALYKTEAVINWDESNDYIDKDQLNFVVLDETGYKRTPEFAWNLLKQYRVLVLDNGVYKQGLFNNETGYTFITDNLIIPQIRSKVISDIPFVFINSKDLLPSPEYPPLLGLANKTWAIYRAEADYRQSLFMQGQDTLVVIGSVRNTSLDPNEQLRVGAGSRIDIDVTGDAKYIGVSSKGLSEQRTCIENDEKEAQLISGRFIGNQSNVESGKSLTVRLGAQTASLTHIVQTGASGLEKILKQLAVWMNLNPDEVQVIPNLDFTKVDFQGQELVNLMTARGQGAPLALESIHANLVDKGLTTLTFEEELAKIKEENKLMNIPEPDAKNKAMAPQPNQLPPDNNNLPTPKG